MKKRFNESMNINQKNNLGNHEALQFQKIKSPVNQ